MDNEPPPSPPVSPDTHPTPPELSLEQRAEKFIGNETKLTELVSKYTGIGKTMFIQKVPLSEGKKLNMVVMTPNPSKKLITFQAYDGLSAIPTEPHKVGILPIDNASILGFQSYKCLQVESAQPQEDGNTRSEITYYYVSKDGGKKIVRENIQGAAQPPEPRAYPIEDMNADDFRKAEDALDLLTKRLDKRNR